MNVEPDSGRTRSSRGAIVAHVHALAALLLSGGHGRGSIPPLLALKVLADLLVLHCLGEAVVRYRAGTTVHDELGLFVVASGVSVALSAILHTRASRIFAAAVPRLVEQLVHRVQHAEPSTIEATGVMSIRLRMTTDAARVLEAGAPTVWFISEALFALAGLLYFCLQTAQAAVLGGLVLLGAVTLITLSGLRVEHHEEEAEARKQTVLAGVEALVMGFTQSKLHRPRSEALAADFSRADDEYLEQRGHYYHSYFGGHALAEALLFGLLGAVVFIYAQWAPSVDAEIDRLVVTGFAIFEPVTMIILDQIELARSGEALCRIRALLDRLGPVASSPDREPDESKTSCSWSRLQLCGVRHAHPPRADGSRFELGPVDFTLKPGEVVFVTGRNGSGKSTFLDLLTGLCSPQAGELRLDGVAQPHPVPQGVRELFGAVLSDFALFDRLYGYGVEGPDPAKVRALLEDMKLDDVVHFVDGAFSTTDLSTGQRKRLAMVVALLRDRPIYVFDEWAADQDPEYRALFYRRLLPALRQRGKAVVAVTHDDREFAAADRRIHFEGGRATEVPIAPEAS